MTVNLFVNFDALMILSELKSFQSGSLQKKIDQKLGRRKINGQIKTKIRKKHLSVFIHNILCFAKLLSEHAPCT